jgi:ketosteroid isomerase-like protein
VRGDQGFAEGTIGYVDADGKKVRVRLCDLYDFREGKVASKRAYTKRIIPE